MTALEINQLVREIGVEVQRRLGGEPLVAERHSCACETPVAAGAPVNGNVALGQTAAGHAIASSITLALLRPETTAQDMLRLFAEAREFAFGSVCVQPSRVAVAARALRGSKTKVAAAIGYPQGATLTPVKLAEAEQVLKLGARELEMVIYPGALRSGDLDGVYTEIRLAAQCAHAAGATLKVLAEMALLGEQEKVVACALARLAGADAVKTSTGLVAASIDDVALAHRVVGGELGIEAAGGVDSYSRFMEVMHAGATSVGTAEGARIVSEAARGASSQFAASSLGSTQS